MNSINNKSRTPLVIFFILLISFCQMDKKDNRIRSFSNKTLDSHLAKAQFYRWYQLYERDMNEKRIANQMEILSDEVFIKSSLGEMTGKKNYPPRLTPVKDWKNAHHVENISVTEIDKSNLKLEADIRYQNIQPKGDKKSYKIHYTTQLLKKENAFPIFTSIVIQPTGETKDEFADAYVANRAKSLMHYWLAAMERLDGKVEPFKEILADKFVLNFSTSNTVIDSVSKLETWLDGPPKSVQLSNHYPENFSVKELSKNEFELNVEFDWYGLSKDGKKLKMRTKHVWHIVDDINNRFAKIKRADVTQLEPLRVVE